MFAIDRLSFRELSYFSDILLGGLVLGLVLFSGLLKERLWLSDPLIALLVGILLGPVVLNWLDLVHWGNPEGILEQGARLAKAMKLKIPASDCFSKQL